MHQTTKSQAFVCGYMYPSDRKDICTSPAKQVKSKIGFGAVANIMPLSIFKMLNPS